MVVCLEEALTLLNVLMVIVASKVAQSKDYPEELMACQHPN